MHINRMKISVIMFLCIFFIGCDSRQTLESHEQSKGTAMDSIKEAGTEFTREELLQDYNQLWEDLEESYPFFSVLTQRGIDIPALKEYYRSLLTGRITDLEGFAVLLNNLFYDMDNLAHLSLMDAEFYYELLKLSEEERLGYTEEPWRSLLWNGQTRVSYALLRSEEETKEPVEILYPEVTMDYYEDLQVVYFKIPSFNHLLLKRDGDLIREYLEEHEDAKHVIFDIRGNRGGSDYYWEENLAAPFGGEYKWNRRLVLKESPLAEIFFLNKLSGELSGFVKAEEIDGVPESVTEMGMTYMGVLNDVDPGELDGKKEAVADLQNVKRWVLIDEAVYSAADNFAGFCKESGWAVLVGTQTGGGASGTGPVAFALKNTGLLIRFSITSYLREDKTLSAVEGIKADIICKSGESPLDACFRAISANNENW